MIAPEGAGARSPHLGVCSSQLIATWDANSAFGREVFARRGIHLAWGTTDQLSADGIPSQAPVVSGYPDGTSALVAWEDSSATGFRVRARTLSASGWESVATLNTTVADAREPSLTADPCGWAYGFTWCVAWTDWRDGLPSTYRRCRTTAWEAEVPLGPPSVACRKPCQLLARSGDMRYPLPVTTFEAAGPADGHGPRGDDGRMRGR
jgi:hypothetical protein